MTALLAVVALGAAAAVVIISMQHPVPTIRSTPNPAAPPAPAPRRQPRQPFSRALHPGRIEPPEAVHGPLVVRARPLLGQFGTVEPDLALGPTRRIAAAGGLVLTTLLLAGAAGASIYLGLRALNR